MEQWIANPQWLWLLALAPVVVALHLLRFRPRQMLVPSTLLWRDTLHENVANQWWQPIKRRLSLLLQLLILLVLSLACAGLQWPQAKRKGRNLLVVLDATHSMSAMDSTTRRSRLDLALDWLERGLADAAADDRFGVATLGASYQVLVPVGSTAGDVRAQLNMLRQTPLGALEARDVAANLTPLVPLTARGTEVLFLTGPFNNELSSLLSSQIGVVSMGAPIDNRAIVHVDATTTLQGALTISVAVNIEGSPPLPLVLQRFRDGAWHHVAARRPPNPLGVVDFRLEASEPRAGRWRVVFEQGDAYPLDDVVELDLHDWVELAPPPLPKDAEELKNLLLSLGMRSGGAAPQGRIHLPDRRGEPSGASAKDERSVGYAHDTWFQGLVREPLALNPAMLVPLGPSVPAGDTLLWLGEEELVRRVTKGTTTDLHFAFAPSAAFLTSDTALVLFGRWLDAQRQLPTVHADHLSLTESLEVRSGASVDSPSASVGETEELVPLPLSRWFFLLAGVLTGVEWWLFRRRSTRTGLGLSARSQSSFMQP